MNSNKLSVALFNSYLPCGDWLVAGEVSGVIEGFSIWVKLLFVVPAEIDPKIPFWICVGFKYPGTRQVTDLVASFLIDILIFLP